MIRGGRRDCVVYVGDLPGDVVEKEVDDLFYKYGRIRRIDVKTQGRPPAYAFVEFDHPRDAEDAVRGRDGYKFAGAYLRVEVARGATGPPEAPRNWREKGTGFRILVEGLPKSASWQDLKDMFRRVETPIYTNVYSDSKGVFGVVEYNSHREVRDIIRTMRGAEFKNPFCDPTPCDFIDDTDEDKRDVGGDRDRSPSPAPRDRHRDRDSRSPPAPPPRARSRDPRDRSRCAEPLHAMPG